jgi:Flp pilus assembly pilin Flp
MAGVWKPIVQFIHDDRGQDLVEYTLLVAGVTVVAVVLLNFNAEPIQNVVNRAKSLLGEGANR